MSKRKIILKSNVGIYELLGVDDPRIFHLEAILKLLSTTDQTLELIRKELSSIEAGSNLTSTVPVLQYLESEVKSLLWNIYYLKDCVYKFRETHTDFETLLIDFNKSRDLI